MEKVSLYSDKEVSQIKQKNRIKKAIGDKGYDLIQLMLDYGWQPYEGMTTMSVDIVYKKTKEYDRAVVRVSVELLDE